MEENDVRDKRDRLITCVLPGNSKQYLGKEYTEQQINEMDSNSIMTLSNRYESVLTLSGPGFEKLAQTGGADSAPPPLNSALLYPN